MHLTRFELNPARRGARFLLASPQRMHAAVLGCFPGDERAATAAGRVLWRVDQHPGQMFVFISSPHSPDMTSLVEQAGWPTKVTWQTRDYTPLLDRLTTGDTWSFRLAANPTRSTVVTEGRRSQRVGHVTVTHQQDWLLRQATRHGFAVTVGEHKEPELVVRDRKTWSFDRAGRTVTLTTAAFEGRLTVTDPDSLRAALTGGIGPAKGYGCGLLTLAR